MASLNASLGLAQLKKIKKILSYKRKLNKEYKKIFKYNYNFKILSEPENCKSNYWLQTLIFNKNKILIRYSSMQIIIKFNLDQFGG